jgi:hypothetical protein
MPWDEQWAAWCRDCHTLLYDHEKQKPCGFTWGVSFYFTLSLFLFFCQYWDLNSGPCVCSMAWATPPTLFTLSFFFWPEPTWTVILPLRPPATPSLLIEVGWDPALSFSFFGLGWPWTRILPISSSWVAEIIGVNHYIWPLFTCFDHHLTQM